MPIDRDALQELYNMQLVQCADYTMLVAFIKRLIYVLSKLFSSIAANDDAYAELIKNMKTDLYLMFVIVSKHNKQLKQLDKVVENAVSLSGVL